MPGFPRAPVSLRTGRFRPEGFTLVEVVVSAFILALITLSVMVTLTFASKMTRLNGYAVVAKNIAQGYYERMLSDDFDHVVQANYPDIAYNSNPPVWLDQGLGITCQVTFQFKGFGTLTNSSTNNLTDNNIHWDADEWAGSTVFLTSGAGAGQFALIDTNTPNTLHLAETLTEAPHNGTQYMIDNGKTMLITVNYVYRGRTYSQSIRNLIIDYRR